MKIDLSDSVQAELWGVRKGLRFAKLMGIQWWIVKVEVNALLRRAIHLDLLLMTVGPYYMKDDEWLIFYISLQEAQRIPRLMRRISHGESGGPTRLGCGPLYLLPHYDFE
ncbi:hypothetical protein PVK06_021866 [Gossypium arboreum]|uniref:Uncharacterized protein n=1 Tax=Gossypium arboreum TaxID=29729 RepID=A0ABR0PRF6_GOSAR|nr:hypothetical protein PVK06_021866 [Gossypium arboreum]